MTAPLPRTSAEAMSWTWTNLEPYFNELEATGLTAESIGEWLEQWSRVHDLVSEVYARLEVGTSVNTADAETEAKLQSYLDHVFEPAAAAEQSLKKKLLATGLIPTGMENPLRQIQAEADLFRDENLPHITETVVLGTEYDKVLGAQTVEWDGAEIPVDQLEKVLRDPDRSRREAAWRAQMGRKGQDRAALNELWGKFYSIRNRMASNAGKSDYRAYVWQELQRFDYTPADCETFHAAIEKVVVPAASRIYERRRQALGVESLRPWDIEAQPAQVKSLSPFTDIDGLVSQGQSIFDKVDSDLAAQFRIMVREGLLDLDSRKNKAPGGYCTSFDVAKRPFIFMNSVGVHDDVLTLFHEAGHAFHSFATSQLPYYQQKQVGSEFCEVASMAMEHLASAHLDGSFYDAKESARAKIEHLEAKLLFWPYMAVVDAFQHWAYLDPKGADPVACDAKWNELWTRFMPGVDWSGLETERTLGWHRKLHIFRVPFYYVEYGLAQVGALQVWRNAMADPAGALASYRHALGLGCTLPLPELFEAAGARFAFDAETLSELVGLVENEIESLGRVS